MVLESEIRVKMNIDGWDAFRRKFMPRPDENVDSLKRRGVVLSSEDEDGLLDRMKRLAHISTILGSSRMVVSFDDISPCIVNEHKLWLLMDFLRKNPDYVGLVESRL